ncbi:hypothetical protein [Marinobacter changyiensis]|uniref:hypothetical protein n=1 Tax=Marinobacter changyiensis TaxID=2604091 RepID=UPI0012642716|nr:hypothetical protein [Marinobacter changyiensis]
MYRLTVEILLGLQLEMDHLRIAPCVRADWNGYKIHYRFDLIDNGANFQFVYPLNREDGRSLLENFPDNLLTSDRVSRYWQGPSMTISKMDRRQHERQHRCRG